MKKNYTSPLATEVNVEAENMLAASVNFGEDSERIETSNAWSNSHRGSWGNLWKM